MARPKSVHPTELELEILKILWEDSPLLASELRVRLGTDANRPLAHSSVATILSIMHDKGLVQRKKKDGKTFLFSPKVDREKVTGKMVGDLMSRLFEGSPSALALNLIESSELDTAELAELRKLINRKAEGIWSA